MKSVGLTARCVLPYMSGPNAKRGYNAQYKAWEWRKSDKFHRENGPAVEYDDGRKHFYLDGSEIYYENEYWALTAALQFQRLVLHHARKLQAPEKEKIDAIFNKLKTQLEILKAENVVKS